MNNQVANIYLCAVEDKDSLFIWADYDGIYHLRATEILNMSFASKYYTLISKGGRVPDCQCPGCRSLASSRRDK